jgi:hypothetical protein
MKNFLFAAFIGLSLAIATLGQQLAASPSSTSTGARTDAGGKVTLPPEKSQPMVIPKTGLPPTIDGHIDEETWKKAAVFKDFYQTGPGYNTAPSRPTEVYMLYDEHNLYVAFKCWDEKDKIRASVAKRDNVYGEDNVRMWIDTYDDQRRAYVMGFNPYGIQQDGIYTEGQGADFSVDIVMESKGVIEDWGWSVEVKIPFRSIRYTAGKGKRWGFNVARNIDRFNDEFDQWMPDDRDVSGFLIKNGRITGLDEIKYERTLEVVPSVTVGESGERVRAPIGFTDGRIVNHPIKPEFGVNLKYTLSPNVTLDAAINPDYAEIEADAPIVSANQRFPIYFQEKRPFFLEGKEIFDSPLQVFYSRNIIDPDVALKVTGKTGPTSYGVLVASDNAPGNFNEEDRTRNEQCKERLALGISNRPCPLDEFLDKNAMFGIVRVKRDFGANNNIGFFGTARIFPQNRNFTGGFDGTYKFNSATVMKFQAIGTHSLKNFYDPATDKNRYRNGNGFGYFWNLDYTKDTHGWYAEIFGRTQDYRADSGFTRRTNTNQAFFALRESTKSNPKARVIRWNFQQFVRYTFDWAGRLQYALAGVGINNQMQGSLFLSFEGGQQWEKNYEEDGFGAKRNNLPPNDPNYIQGAFFGAPTRSAAAPYVSWNINKVFNKQLSVYGFGFLAWGSFDYDFGGGDRYPRVSPAALVLGQIVCRNGITQHCSPLDPGPGFQTNFGGGLTYKPIQPLTVSLDYTKDKLRRNDTHLLSYDTNIISLRSTYQFTRFTFARVRIDYDTLNSSIDGQYLVGWNPNPGTAFYVGYNDSTKYNGFNPFSGDLHPGFERESRRFFIRMSWLFRRTM